MKHVILTHSDETGHVQDSMAVDNPNTFKV